MVRAKMRLNAVETTDYGHGSKRTTLRFAAQYDPDAPEDQRFQAETPTASADFVVDNPAALQQFAPGQSYYFDITEVPPQ